MPFTTTPIVTTEKITKKIIKTLSSPVSYSFSEYIGSSSKLSGKGVKIAVLDSGFPTHKDIKETSRFVSFIDSDSSDKYGHATMVSGIIAGSNPKGISGLSKNATVFYGKVLDDKGNGNFNAMVAGVLWAIVKEVDIIVMAIGTDYDYNILHDALIKAKQYGICVFAAAGRNLTENPTLFPSAYKEVFSTSFLTRKNTDNKIIREKVNFCLPEKNLFTTYKNDQYIQTKGSSMSTAFFAGIAACLIEEYKDKKIAKEEYPSLVYNYLNKKQTDKG